MVRGKRELEAAVGRAALKAARASTKFPGSNRATPRGSIYPYVYRVGEEFVVGAPDATELRKSLWLEQATLDAAMSHVERLNNEGLESPPQPTPLAEWIVEESVVLGLDTEGDLDRISMATDDQCGSWQWNDAVRWVVQLQLDAASIILAHYAPHDMRLLQEAGLVVHPHKWRCTLVAHGLLHPHRNRGLGYAAPMYFPVMPWKGMIEDDPELYSVMDAWVLVKMWAAMGPSMDTLRLWPLYQQDLTLTRMLHEPLGNGRNAGQVPGIQGNESTVTRAAGCLENKDTRSHSDHPGWLTAVVSDPDGRIACGIRDPYAAALRFLCGFELPALEGAAREALVRYACGLGIDASRKGTGRLTPLLEEFPTRASLKAVEGFAEVDAWLATVKRQLHRDKHVANPFGRRWNHGTGQQAAQFLLLSTINDVMRGRITKTGIKPCRLSFGCAWLESSDKAAAFLAGQNPTLPQVEVLP